MKCVGLDNFALKNFDADSIDGSYINITPHFFLEKVNRLLMDSSVEVVPGYAPFCKHIFIKNFTNKSPSHIKLTDNIVPFIRSNYVSRRKEELPVLQRWVESQDIKHLKVVQPAKYLDLILYSDDQIAKENYAMKLVPSNQVVVIPTPHEYSIISIKAQNVNFELPMDPITIMRNCMISKGGSGVELDETSYYESVEFWKENISFR